MQVLFTSRHPRAEEFRALSEQRLRFALRRLQSRVPLAEVQLSDLNGPKGGLDKRCQIALRTDGAGTVVVASVARHWRAALEQALARATRFLLRLWRRSQDDRKLRQRLLRDER